jgi:hypothetical protein
MKKIWTNKIFHETKWLLRDNKVCDDCKVNIEANLSSEVS